MLLTASLFSVSIIVRLLGSSGIRTARCIIILEHIQIIKEGWQCRKRIHGHEINILDLVVVCIQARVAGCILAPVVEPILVQMVECTPVLEAGCIAALVGAYPRALVVGFTQVQTVDSILVQAVDCTLAPEVVYIAGQAAECILVPAITLIEATYHLGPYSLNILRNKECKT